MKALWRFTVSVLLVFTVVNTTETEEDNKNVLSISETLHSDENDSSDKQEITEDYAKTLYNDYERRRRLQSIHDNLATKLQKAIVDKLKSPEYNQRVNLTTVEKYLEHDIDVPSGRRSFNNDPEEVTEDASDGRRNYIKKVTYVIDQQPVNQPQVVNVKGERLQDLQAINSGTRAGYIVNNGIKVPQQYAYLNDKMNTLPNYYVYGQPYMDFTNPIKMYYNYYPGNRIIKINNNFFDYANHVRAYNHVYDFKLITTYITSLMDTDKYNNPLFDYIFKGANDLNLAEINNFDTTHLVKIDKSDLDYLKKYIILVLNKYGMTPYLFKLLEYVNLIDGRPRNEVYLVFKILSNQRAVYGLNKVESDQLKAHLQYILNEYGKSHYIVPFLRNIGGIQFEKRGHNLLYDFDFGNLDPSSYLNRDNMRKIYIHLSQIYNNNHAILQILQNINRINDNRNGVTILPKLEFNEYQNLYYLSQNDLYLLARYITQIQRQRGDHTYLNELLFYISKLQTLDKGTYVSVIKDDDNVVKGLDLTGLYKILLDINNTKGLKPEVQVTINRLIDTKTVSFNDIDRISNDLKVLKDNLIQNHIYEYDQLLIKILYELNNLRKNENLPPIEDESEKWINIKITDLELILQYLTTKEKLQNNPYVIVFVNEIIQIIERGKLNPYERINYKFRYADLLKLYNNIQMYEKDEENPIYVMIKNYLDRENDNKDIHNDSGTSTNPELYAIMKYFGDKQINLNNIYKFLIYEIESGNQSEVVLKLLQLLQRTLLLPNGELKFKIISLNETQSYRQINPNDLRKVYLYLQEIIEDKMLSVHLLEFYRKLNYKDELIAVLFNNATKESLNRLRNFLLILIKEHGENPYILEILIEINNILQVPDDYKYIINDANSEVNEDDLILLIKYFSELNFTENSIDIEKIIDYLQETKEKIQKGDTEEWIHINAQDLEIVYQYLLGKDKFLHSPYLALFVNEILPLIQQGKQNPYENIIYKFKRTDLLQLYTLILSDEKDKDNPVFKKILKYLDNDIKNINTGTHNLDLHVLYEYFGGDQVNLDIVYKFLINEILSGNTNELLIEFLQFIKDKLLLPNGLLKHKIFYFNGPEPTGQISPSDLQKLYMYLQKLMEDDNTRIKLLDYKKSYRQIFELFSYAPKETLNRIRNFLLVLIKEQGENRYIGEVLSEINTILRIPESKNDHMYVLNGTNPEVKTGDLKLLIKYFSLINTSNNNDVAKILQFLVETEEGIEKSHEKSNNEWIYINAQDLEVIYQYLLGKERFINSPYLVKFVNEILPFIHKAKQRQYENLLYKFKYIDLLTLFNTVLKHEKDKENPIYLMILEYLNDFKDDTENKEKTANVDFQILNEYFEDKKINIALLYKFLSHEIASGSHTKVLVQLLHIIKRNLLLPNGQLKVQVIYINGTDPNIHPYDLQKLYFYLQKLIENEILGIELLDYMKKYKQKQKQMHDIFIEVNPETLIRLRNYLLIIIKELGESPFIIDVLFEINHILEVHESPDKYPQIFNGTSYEVNESDLDLLIKYFTEINIYGKNSDLINVLDFIQVTKENIKHNQNDSKGDWISVNVRELELIYKYLLSNEMFQNSPYAALFINDIRPLIQQGKEHPNEIVIYKFRTMDLIKIYKFLISHEKDKDNPILLRILHYLKQVTNNTTYDNVPNVDIHFLNNYFGDNQINLDIVYNFLTHKVNSGNPSKVLVELLEILKRIQLPNGQLKIKIIHLNETETEQMNPNYLQDIYLYLEKIINDNTLRIDLLEYYTKERQQYKQISELLNTTPKESLSRLRNFLLILIQEGDGNPKILEIIFEINRILGIPENDDKHRSDANVDENDIEILERIISLIKGHNINIKVMDKIIETKERIKDQKENAQKSKLFQAYVIEIMDSKNISPDVKFILHTLSEIGFNKLNQTDSSSDFDLSLRKAIENLSSGDLNILTNYLQMLIYSFKPIYLVQRLLPYVEKIKEKHRNDTTNKHINETTNEYVNVNISRHNLDVLNSYLMELIKLYGENSNILHIIYKINNIEVKPGTNNDLYKLTNNTNVATRIEVRDVNEIVKYLLNLIKNKGATPQLIKILTEFSKLPKETEKNTRNVTPINSTHTLVILDNDDVNKIKSYLVKMINDYGSNPFLMNLLKVINPKGQDYNTNKHLSVYTFAKLNKNDLNLITSYILQLIEQGASPEYIEVLNFIYEINGDVNEERKENEYILEISKELQELRDNNIIQIMKNMDRSNLISIYIHMLETIFNTPTDFTRVLVKLLDVYRKEDSPLKKYIILKWYEYLIRNKGASYKTLRNPDFIHNLLELDDKGSNRDVIITTETSVKPHYSSDIDKILSELIDNTLRNKATNDSLEERKMNNSTEDKPDLRDRTKDAKTERKSCIKEPKKYYHISKVLHKLKRHDIDISDNDLERIFDIFFIFANQLKYEKHRGKIETSLIIDELEKRLLTETENSGKCEKSDTVKHIISTVVVHLRDIIAYLKSMNFSKEEIMTIVKSTLEDDIMPDINAISVQECTAAVNKEILDALLTNIYSKTYENENIELIDMTTVYSRPVERDH